MRRGRLRVALPFLVVFVSGSPLRAQRAPTLAVQLPSAEQLARTGPLVTASDMLSSARARDPLAHAFPARFHFVVELWSEGGFTNQIERRAEYDVVVALNVVEKKYEVVQSMNDRLLSLGKFDRIEDAEGAVARPTRAPIKAMQSGKTFYYRVTLDVQILGASDLDEVNRWLKGEFEPAIHGDRNPGTAFTRSLRMLASRLLGGESRQYGADSPRFRVP